MSLIGNFFRKAPSLDSVTFDHSAYAYQGERNGAKIWFLAEGGGVGLYFFSHVPNLPASPASTSDLQNFYSSQLAPKQRLVEFRLQAAGEVKGIWMITADPQTGGLVYLGSITIPFQKFSYVVKVQCQEIGVTGLREAVVLDWALKNGKASVGEDGVQMHGFSPEDEQFDPIVPRHPLSRVRNVSRHTVRTLRIDPGVKAHASFGLP